MNKMILSAFVVLMTAFNAHAGSSATILACSSESGRTVISGILPGQGEVEVDLNVSIGSAMTIYSSERRDSEATVDVSAKLKKVRITVKNGNTGISIKADGDAVKLTENNNGTSGSFVGELTGTHPATYENIQEPIKVRCHMSDEI